MLIGVNWLSPHSAPMIKTLLTQGHANFCEIMIDNVIHLSPDKIKQAINDVPVAFHIVSSRFLERSSAELKDIAKQLRIWIQELQPIYVSDHLASFTTSDGVRLPRIAELDYERDYAHIKNKIIEWQELLDTHLILENFASTTEAGKQQAQMYEQLLAETQAGLLFDFSNAYIAQINQIAPLTAWDELIQSAQHFHVGGFRIDADSQLAIDTHDASISQEVVNVISKKLSANKTLVIEFDENIDTERWQNEIARVRSA